MTSTYEYYDYEKKRHCIVATKMNDACMECNAYCILEDGGELRREKRTQPAVARCRAHLNVQMSAGV